MSAVSGKLSQKSESKNKEVAADKLSEIGSLNISSGKLTETINDLKAAIEEGTNNEENLSIKAVKSVNFGLENEEMLDSVLKPDI